MDTLRNSTPHNYIEWMNEMRYDRDVAKETDRAWFENGTASLVRLVPQESAAQPLKKNNIPEIIDGKEG